MPVPYLQVDNLTKSFGDRLLFSNVSFGVAEGQRIAIVARNGSGKTTLLNILTGHEDYDSGSITYRRDLKVAYLRQQTTDVQIPTGEKESLLYQQYLSKLKVRGTHSGGEQKRIALAAVLASQPDLLILDEPTNHLDLDMVIWLEDFLRRSQMALLMVTHDRYFLDRVCSDILEIDQQQLFAYHGNYSYYLEKRAERIEVFNSETDRMRNLYRYELDWMRRMPQARGHKSRERIQNFYQLEDRVHQSIAEKDMHLVNRSVYIGNKIWEAKDVCKRFESKTILDNFNYTFARHEKLGIIGNNGTGKTTFIRMLLGEEPTDSGAFDIGQTVQFGYFSQTGLPPTPGKKVLDIITAEAEYIDLGAGNRLSASQFLQHFLFTPSQQRDFVEKLSGGERQRLNLCRVLMRNPNFLILDEPTNDLDIQTMNILEDYLQHFTGCLMVVSHDRYFMDKVVDHLLVFRGNAEVKDYPGNYTQWRAAEEDTKAASVEAAKNNGAKVAPIPEAPAKQKTEQKRRLSFKEQQELKALEQSMPLLEAEKAELEAKLSGGLSDLADIQAASQRYDEVKTLLDIQELRWLELSEI